MATGYTSKLIEEREMSFKEFEYICPTCGQITKRENDVDELVEDVEQTKGEEVK